MEKNKLCSETASVFMLEAEKQVASLFCFVDLLPLQRAMFSPLRWESPVQLGWDDLISSCIFCLLLSNLRLK